MGKRPIDVHDLWGLKFLSDPRMSPDGTRIAYSITRIDETTQEYRTGIYIHERNEEDYCIISDGSRPAWSPDSKMVAFLSSRSGTSQIWLTQETMGEPKKLTSMRYGVTDLTWSPDGTRLLFVSACAGDEESEILLKEMEASDREANQRKAQNEAMKIENIYYRADEASGLLPSRNRQLWMLDINSGKLEALTDANTHIFSRLQTTPIWSPDGQKVAFTSNHQAQKERSPYLGANASDVFVMDIKTRETQRIVHGNGTAAYPVWSPDSRSLAYFWYDQLEHLTSSTLPKLYRVQLDTKESECLTTAQDVSLHVGVQSDLLIGHMPAAPVWTQSGQILFWGSREGRAHVYSVSDQGGAVQPITGFDGSVFAMSADATGRKMALAVMDTTRCMELWECQTETGECILCTDPNQEMLEELNIAEAEEFWVETEDGLTIHAWLMPPPGKDKDAKYPLIMHIHGGPHLLYGNAFNFEFQLMASRGYGILYANPRGSAGYGQEFLKGCCGDFGGKDYQDLLRVLDAALEKEGRIDQDRLGVTGLSYGGFMTNWVVGHTDRFKAAVTKNCLSNLLSFSGVSDIGYFFLEGEQLGNPWVDRDRMEELSPLTYVQSITTPLLIMHTQDDQRCPIEQSEQLYTAMKYFEKEVAFYRYPSGNHLMYRLGKPSLRVAWLQDTVDWFEKYLDEYVDGKVVKPGDS